MFTCHAGSAEARHVRPARAAVPFLVALMLLVAPAAVLGHADLAASTPADGATVEGTPPLVELRFTEPLNSKSSIELVGSGGSLATGTPVPGDLLAMTLVAPDLSPGLYTVRWTAGTDDGHIERGSVTFTVVAPPPTPSPSPPPTATPAPSATPSPTATPDQASPSPSPEPTDPVGGESPDLTVLLAVAAVAVVLGFATRILLRERGTR